MGLKEVKKDLEEKIEEAIKLEEAPAEEVKEEVKEEPKTEEVKEESKAEEKKEEEKPVEAKKTPAEYAEERRERKANRELEEARKRIAELEAAVKKPEPKADPEPNKEEDPQGWTEWQLRKTQDTLGKVVEITAKSEQQRVYEKQRADALDQVAAYESVVRSQNKDYDDAKKYYANTLAYSIKRLNPKIADAQLVQMVNDRMLLRASELLNEGHDNPIEAMYNEAKDWGYKPNEEVREEKKEVKPDLKIVAENRRRNAGTAGAQGDTGRADVTPTVAAGMTNAEFARLSVEQKAKMFQQLGARG